MSVTKILLNANLNRHIDAVHKEKKKFKCTICDEVFSQKRALNRHIESVHEGKKSFKCTICDKGFSQQ